MLESYKPATAIYSEKVNIYINVTMKGLDTVESLSVEVKGSKVSLKYF